jgi:uncharacterized cupredoxin-like copper-binding protein
MPSKPREKGSRRKPITSSREGTVLEVSLDAGTYKLYCPVGNYEQRGMTGMVTVKEG